MNKEQTVKQVRTHKKIRKKNRGINREFPRLEDAGIDPATSRMLSERSTI